MLTGTALTPSYTGLHLPPDVSLTAEEIAELDRRMHDVDGVWDGSAYRFLIDPRVALRRFEAGESSPRPVVLSFGMGLESTAILLRWLLEPESRDFSLEDLVVLTAQTGDEFRDLSRLLRLHIIPLLEEHGVRWVQVAREGRLQTDGVAVLDDSRSGHTVCIGGRYKLSDEMTSAGTVPQMASGQRKCSIHAKGWPLDGWLDANVGKRSFLQVIGFNRDETKRMERDRGYSTKERETYYPLAKEHWNWGRAECEAFILKHTGVVWPKSACSYCPFAFKPTLDAMAPLLTRFRAEPDAAANALMLEFVSVALNPRMTLYAARSLRSVVEQADMPGVVAQFEARLEQEAWAIYRVRRYYKAAGSADRSTQVVARGSRKEMVRQVLEAGGSVDTSHGYTVARVYHAERGETYPAREEFLVACPALVDEKQRSWFERNWSGAAVESVSL